MTLRFSSRDLRLLSNATTAMLSPTSFASERAWHLEILGRVSRLTASYKSGVRVPGRDDHPWTALGFESAAIHAYNSYFKRFDFGRALGGSQASGTPVVSLIGRFQDRLPALRRSEFYADFLCPFGFFDGITLSTRKHEQHKGSTLYLWHERELTNADRARAIAILGLLAPAFRSGMRARVRLASGHGAFLRILDDLSEGCALFTQSGIMLHQNPALSQIRAECLDRSRLEHTLLRVVASVRASVCWSRGGATASRATFEEVTGLEGVYRVSGCLIDQSPEGSQAAILTIVTFDRTDAPVARPEQLRRHFGLSNREAEVTLLLASRRTNHEIATSLGMSEHTARHHTESIMRKMSVASRTEIASMLRRTSSDAKRRGRECS